MLNSHSVLNKIYPLIIKNYLKLNKPTIDYSFNFYFISLLYSQSSFIITSFSNLWIYKLKIFINIQTKQTNIINYLNKKLYFDFIYKLKKFKIYFFFINDNKNIINIYEQTKNKFHYIKEIYFLSTYSKFYKFFINQSLMHIPNLQNEKNFFNFSHNTLTGYLDNIFLEKGLKLESIDYKKAFIFKNFQISTLFLEFYIKSNSYHIFIL
jgi:hypothetical protein